MSDERTVKDAPTFEEVIAVLSAERQYQDGKWGSQNAVASITAFAAYIQDYVAEAVHLQARNDHDAVKVATLDAIRKATALGIACMQAHGVTERVTG